MVRAAMRVAALVLFASLMSTQRVSAQDQCEETDISARMSQAEDRVSRLEDRLYSVLSQSPGTSANDTLILADLVERLADVTRSLQNMSLSNQEENQTPVCERGMASKVSEPYLLLDNSLLNRKIRCDTQTDGGGWIVFQRRATGDVDFYKNWAAYRAGFGDLDGDFWLGNQALHTLTNANNYELRVDVRFDGQDFFAQFSTVRVENESQKFRLHLGTYSGTVGDSGGSGMIFNDNGRFSTFDQDNDDYSHIHCAVSRHGAWWYKQCTAVNLNGEWGVDRIGGMRWYNGATHRYAEFSEMKIRVV